MIHGLAYSVVNNKKGTDKLHIESLHGGIRKKTKSYKDINLFLGGNGHSIKIFNNGVKGIYT